MKKLLITTALLFTALPFTLDGVTPAVSTAHARIGRPFTPLSFAGVHRRAVRRTFGVGANLGYRGYHPVARAAVAGAALSSAAAYGAGYYGAGYGYGEEPLYDYAGGYGADYADGYGAPVSAYAVAAPGWGGGWGGWGWNRPIFGAGLGWGGGWGWGRGWGSWGWRRW
jgi:hypothetical protein